VNADGAAGVLAPAGPAAQSIALQTVWLFAGGTLLFVLVMTLLALAMRRGGRSLRPRAWLLGGGVVLPLVVLAPLLVDSVRRSAALDAAAPADALLVGVGARMWWWELRYADPDGGPEILAANELHVPVGRTVRLALASDDVIHSLWVPALAGKMDLVPGRIQHLQLRADRPGVYLGACAEFCGEQHTRMGFRIIAMPAAEFDRWLQQQRAQAAAHQAVGRDAFVAAGCAVCHRVSGVSEGRFGPDLSHVASRQTLGAGRLPNDEAALRQWIVDVQRLKPGARMPSFTHLDDATLAALTTYLASLK
jgi:cytochrome c oxidase subunit II